MVAMGWKRLLADGREFRRPGRFPIAAYSEFMPPPRLVRKPYGTEEPGPFSADDPSGWQVSEYEEALQLRPGMEHLAAELLHAMEHLGHGRPAHGISQARLADNPFWPPELADRAGTLSHERYVALAPLALSHPGQNRLNGVEHAVQVDGKNRPDFLRSFLLLDGAMGNARQDDDHIQGLNRVRFGNPGRHGFAVRDIHYGAGNVRPHGAADVRKGLHAPGIQVAQKQMHPRSGIGPGQGRSDASGGPGFGWPSAGNAAAKMADASRITVHRRDDPTISECLRFSVATQHSSRSHRPGQSADAG